MFIEWVGPIKQGVDYQTEAPHIDRLPEQEHSDTTRNEGGNNGGACTSIEAGVSERGVLSSTIH